MRRIFATVLVSLLSAASADATSVLRLEREELARRATRVFEGTVVDVRGERDAGGRIATRVRFAVEADGWWKGTGGGAVELLLPGGILEAEERALLVPGMPRFERGERAVVFASEATRGGETLAIPVGLKQGKLRVVLTPNGRRALERELSGLQLVDPATREVNAAPRGPERFDYDAWKAAVRRIAEER
ncbi:MAG: hypothetical protein IPN34_18565 [Planctomycetes bacterium]|nr:hypothetical protein [Planctomycetota bacterium]